MLYECYDIYSHAISRDVSFNLYKYMHVNKRKISVIIDFVSCYCLSAFTQFEAFGSLFFRRPNQDARFRGGHKS